MIHASGGCCGAVVCFCSGVGLNNFVIFEFRFFDCLEICNLKSSISNRLDAALLARTAAVVGDGGVVFDRGDLQPRTLERGDG